MRLIADIKDDITSKENELRALYGELDDVMRAYEKDMLRRFDEGESFAHIGRQVGLPAYTVKNILWRNGRTKRGREALRTHRASLRPLAVTA